MSFMDSLMQVIDQINKMGGDNRQQIAADLSRNNPYQPVIRQSLTNLGTLPTLNAIEEASNWELNNQRNNLAEQEFNARTTEISPEMLSRTGMYSADNLNAPYVMTPGQRRFISDVSGVNNTEYGLRQRDKVKTAQASVLQGLQPYLDRIKGTSQGAMYYGMLSNPDLFGDNPDQWNTIYSQVPKIVQEDINRTAQAGSTQKMIEAMPDSPTKTLLQQLDPVLSQPGMEGVAELIYKSALGSVPKTPTENDKLRNRLIQTQIENIYADNRRADAKEKEIQSKAIMKETTIKASDIANRISANAASYRTYEDYVADLERHRGDLIPLIGIAAYNKLKADAPNIFENVFGSKFVPESNRKVKSGYITFLLNELKKPR